MYVIEDGKAYLVNGEVGCLINFDTNGKSFIEKDKTIDIAGKERYTYDEMYRKLNIAYMIEEAKRKNALKGIANDEINELNAKIDALTKENNALKAELEAVKAKKVEETKEETPNEEVTEKVEETKEETSKKETNKKENK